jgi:undecaprenyl pyrophosphate phosphatase UppP
MRVGVNDALDLPEGLDHFMHGPTLIVLACSFRRVWVPLACRVMRIFSSLLHGCALRASQKRLLLLVMRIIGMVVVADAVVVCGYLLRKGPLHDVAFLESLPVLMCGFIITGGALISLSLISRRSYKIFSYSSAALIGALQVISLIITGTSRFGLTVVGAQWLGISPRRALEFSFLTFVPLIGVAFIGNGIPAAIHYGGAMLSIPWLMTLIGSTIVAYFFFVGACYLTLANRLWWFGSYILVPLTVCMLLLGW